MRYTARLPRVLMVCCAVTIAAAADPVLVEISLPDLTASRAHWSASQIGRLVNEPEVAPLWTSIRTELQQQRPLLELWDMAWPTTTAVTWQLQDAASGQNGQPTMVLGIASTDVSILHNAIISPDGLLAPLAEALPVISAEAALLTLSTSEAKLAPSPTVAGDIVVRWSATNLANFAQRSGAPPIVSRLLTDLLANGSATMLCGGQGLDIALRLDATPVGLAIPDRATLQHIPSTADAAMLIGIDGPVWWKAHRASILGAVGEGMSLSADDVALMASTPLAMVGVQDGLDGLAESFKGTLVAFVDHGLPTVGLTRSAPLDQLVQKLLLLCQQPPPKSGEFRFVIIPSYLTQHADISPFGLCVGCTASHWWFSFDAVGLGDLLAGKDGEGLAGTESGRLIAAAPPDSHIVGAVRSRDLLRSLVPMVGIYASIPKRGHWAGPILHLAWRLVRDSGMDTIVAGPTSTGWTLLTRGTSGGFLGASSSSVAVMAIIASIAIPNLMESRVTANEAAASSSLKSGFFPAQIMFQSGAYQDADADNVGEFGLLDELTGRVQTNKVAAGFLILLQGPLATGLDRISSGYHFAVYLPDGAGGAISDDSDLTERHTAKSADANAQEKYFVVYAWPVSRDTGRRMFALTSDGQVRTMMWDGDVPNWNAVFGGAGFDAEPTWPAYQR